MAPSTLCHGLQRVQDAAEQYLQQIQARPGHLQTCMEAVASAQRAEVQFWCLKAILEVR